MEKNIQKYELQQDKKIYILITSLIGNNKIKICCYPSGHKFGYQNEFSLDDLIKINQIFSNYKSIEEVQNEMEKIILDQKISLLHNRTIFDIIFIITYKISTVKISLRLNYQGEMGFKHNKYNDNLLQKIEEDTSTILKEQNILRKKIEDILSSNIVYNSINKNIPYKKNNRINPIMQKNYIKTNNNSNIIYNNKKYVKINNINKNNNNFNEAKTFLNNDMKNNQFNNGDSKNPQNNEESKILKNISELKMLENKLKMAFQTKRNIRYKLIYRASRDSDKAESFHKKCNGIKNTVILIESNKGKRFGGFTSQTWDGNIINKEDEKAFIFSLDKLKIYDIIPGKKAISCRKEYGPAFCGYQILIYDKAFINGGRTFIAGQNYNTEEDYEISGGYDKYEIKEIEAFQIYLE